ncbi:MAG: IPT/TIG domain-containing protein [Chloroflexota bacterium]|nr:IPT/TIG domain-containing protein [Chloroflexota bacterium]
MAPTWRRPSTQYFAWYWALLVVLTLFLAALALPSVAHAGDDVPLQERSPDLAEIVVADDDVTDFFLLNGTIFYARCYGDVGSFTSELKRQLADGTVESLWTQSDCYRFRQLQADPTAVYYNDEPAQKIRRRMVQSPSVVFDLASYVSGTAPTAMALADGYVYWTTVDDAVRRVSIYGGTVQDVMYPTTGEPTSISVDDYFIWFGTTSGVYRIDRGCSVPCTPHQERTGWTKEIYGASTGTGLFDRAVFWVRYDVLGDPDQVESWDGNIPGSGSSSIQHTIHRIATLGSIDAVIATDDHVWWLERDGTSGAGQLRRIGRGVAENPSGGPYSERMDANVLPQDDWFPSRLQLYNEYLYYRSNGVSRLHQDSPPLIWNFNIQYIEVTSGQQNLTDPEPHKIANKRTFVRVYGQQLVGDDIAYPEAILEGTRDGVPMEGSPLQAIVSPSLLQTGTPFDRADIDTTWLFELPPEWTVEDEIRLEATIDPRRMYDDNLTGAVMDQYASFYEQVPICLVAVRVRQHGPYGRHTDPEYVHLTSQMLDMSPTDELGLYHKSGYIEEGVWPFNHSAYDLPQDKKAILQNLYWHNIWSDDPDGCDGDSGEGTSHYVGLIHHTTSTGTAIGRAYVPGDELWVKFPATAGTTQGWPVQQRSAVLAHETYHNYGRKHVNCGGGLSGPDPNYPGDNCQLLPADYWGFEPRTQTPISPTMGSDVMTYSGPQWISRYTWLAMFNQLYPTREPVEAQTMGPESSLVLVTGEINLLTPSRSRLNHAWVMETSRLGNSMQRKWVEIASPAVEPETVHLVDYTVQFLDSRNVVLATHPVIPVATDEPTDPMAPVHFGLTAPRPSGAVAKIRLRANSTQLDELVVGRNAPVLRMLAPTTSITVDDLLTVRWESYDPDGDIPHFMVQYRATPSSPWQALSTDLIGKSTVAQYEVNIDSTLLPGSTTDNAVVQVVASDGFNTSTVLSHRFRVLRRAPEAVIVWPPADYWLEAGKMITLEGWGTDAEDGWLDDSRLNWYLDGSSLGTGDSKQVSGLAPGSHLVQLTASDSDGQHQTASRTFHVSPLAIARGSARLDGRCNDATYAGSSLIMLQPYDDGSQARVVFARDDEHLWACFSGLKNQGPSSPGSYAGIRLDGNLSQDPLAQPSDYGFYVGQDGLPFTRQGNGSGGFGDDTPVYVDQSLAAFTRSNHGGSTWNAELRIGSAFSGVSDHMGIMLGHYWVDAQGDDYNWPYSAVWNAPNTWAEGFFDSVPKITALSPMSATLPTTTGILLEVHGENFKSSDDVLWDGSSVSTLYSDPQLLMGIIPTGLQTAGEHTVTVQRLSGNIVSNPLQFTVYNPVLTINGPYPDEILQGTSGAEFQVFADGVSSGAQLFLDGQPLTTLYQGLGWMKGYLTDEQVRLPGPRKVTLRNASPVAQMSNGLTLTITSCGLVGDFDHDMEITVADLISIADRWGESAPPYDLDDDGEVTVKDIMMVAGTFGDTCP